eukprot:scaffold67233_cov17-Tisochrysis_lutea.AAC.3
MTHNLVLTLSSLPPPTIAGLLTVCRGSKTSPRILGVTALLLLGFIDAWLHHVTTLAPGLTTLRHLLLATPRHGTCSWLDHITKLAPGLTTSRYLLLA